MRQGDPGHRRFVVPKVNAKKMGPRKTRGKWDQVAAGGAPELENPGAIGCGIRHPEQGGESGEMGRLSIGDRHR